MAMGRDYAPNKQERNTMIYKIELFTLKYERHTLKEKKQVATVFLSDYSLDGRFDDMARVACQKAGIRADSFSCDGLQSCRDRYHPDDDLPPSWRHLPGKWEPVMAGSI